MKRRHFSVLFAEKVEKKKLLPSIRLYNILYILPQLFASEKKKKILGLGQTRCFLNPQRTYVIKFKRAQFSLLMVT